MELYKIVFAEFERFETDKDFVYFSTGSTNKAYKDRQQCVNAMKEEFEYIKSKSYYKKVEIGYVDDYEFKLKCTTKDKRKQTIHHYKIVDFNI